MPTANVHHDLYRQVLNARMSDMKTGGQAFFETLRAKINTLEPESFTDRKLESYARMGLALLEDVVRERYLDVSLRLFAHLAVTLDYFLDHNDAKPDHEPGGWEDDLQRFLAFSQKFGPELQAYRQWKAQQGDQHVLRRAGQYVLGEDGTLSPAP